MPVNNLDCLQEGRKVDCFKSCRLLIAGDFCFYLQPKCGRTFKSRSVAELIDMGRSAFQLTDRPQFLSVWSIPSQGQVDPSSIACNRYVLRVMAIWALHQDPHRSRNLGLISESHRYDELSPYLVHHRVAFRTEFKCHYAAHGPVGVRVCKRSLLIFRTTPALRSRHLAYLVLRGSAEYLRNLGSSQLVFVLQPLGHVRGGGAEGLDE
jgi:hypothetical protein